MKMPRHVWRAYFVCYRAFGIVALLVSEVAKTKTHRPPHRRATILQLQYPASWLGFQDEAVSYFRKALRINDGYLEAKENLNNVSSALVERWHFRMLNDIHRNKAYKEAIKKAINEGYDTVLDIGAGTAILSMFSVQSGAKHVYGCEMSKTMYELGRDVLVTNHMSDKVMLLNMKSTDMTIPRDLPCKVSLVVTETVDAGLFGEGIVETLQHAWQHLLANDRDTHHQYPINGKVIPSKAIVFAQLVECEAIRKQHRVTAHQIGNLTLNCDLISATMAAQCKTSNCTVEPYSTERMSTVCSGFTPLSNAFKVRDIDFNSAQILCSAEPCGPDVDHQISVTKSGHLDAIVSWFTLHLYEDCALSTSPNDESCWEQAVFPIHPLHICQGDGDIQAGNTVTVTAAYKDSHLSLHIPAVAQQEMQNTGGDTVIQQSSNQDDISDPSDANTNTVDGIVSNKENDQAFVLSHEEIMAINDVKYQNILHDVIRSAIDRHKICNTTTNVADHVTKYSQQCKGASTAKTKFVTMDISPSFSLAGLHVAKAGATRVYFPNIVEDCQNALQWILTCNTIEGDVIEYGQIQDGDMVDLLIADIIESRGVFRQRVLEDIAMARTSLRGNGSMIPSGVSIRAMCIHSTQLLQDSCVIDDQHTLGLHIAPFVNIFQATTHLDVDMITLSHQRITDAFQLMELDFTSNSDVNALPLYLENKVTVRVPVLENSSITAIVFWFEVHLDKDHTICTLDRETHWRQAAVIMKNAVNVHKGETIEVKATLKDSCIDIRLLK
ncbi:protein arginine N-methyltransferase 9-like isoform X2 [Ptychodera flava]|uniref:protein arginine N-methyltransferase 9-like isoform X2 n=1 Tax=Ptychodera flava TaxID=63121 RepID=UPI00396A716C